MECAAATAVAKFREKEFFEFFYAADNLAAEQWDKRSLSNEARVEEKDRVAILALELATKIIARYEAKYMLQFMRHVTKALRCNGFVTVEKCKKDV